MDIEEVAERTPDKILTVQIDPLVGVCDFQARNLGYELDLSAEAVRCVRVAGPRTCTGSSWRRTSRSPRSTRS